jgi:hypothetical protein
MRPGLSLYGFTAQIFVTHLLSGRSFTGEIEVCVFSAEGFLGSGLLLFALGRLNLFFFAVAIRQGVRPLLGEVEILLGDYLEPRLLILPLYSKSLLILS